MTTYVRGFYCDTCERWTDSEPVDHLTAPAICSSCGESYQCGECGYEIDARGECQRPAELGACPASS